MRNMLIAMVVGSFLILGCSEDVSQSVLQPDFEGSADGYGPFVVDHGDVAVDGEIAGEFTEDLLFHGYGFDVGEGAVVSLEVTQRGTSRALDATMFVFGPLVEGNPTQLAVDNDSGWGPFPRIEDLALPEAGRYLVVIGTASGTGRGHYNLAVTCESESCAPTPISDLFTECDDEAADYIHECVSEDLMDSAYELSPREAFEQCADVDRAGDVYDYVCGYTEDEDFCAEGLSAFVEHMWPLCVESVGASYPAEQTTDLDLELVPIEAGEEIEGIVSNAIDACYVGCWYDAALYDYEWDEPGAAPIDDILIALRNEQDLPNNIVLTVDDAPPMSEILDWTNEAELYGLLDAIYRTVGDEDPETAKLSGSYYNGGDGWITFFVLHFPESHRVATILFDIGED